MEYFTLIQALSLIFILFLISLFFSFFLKKNQIFRKKISLLPAEENSTKKKVHSYYSFILWFFSLFSFLFCLKTRNLKSFFIFHRNIIFALEQFLQANMLTLSFLPKAPQIKKQPKTKGKIFISHQKNQN